MRSLFHFPLPCTTTLAVTVSYSNRPTAPEMCHRPHPAPMRRQRRSPVLLSAARPLPGPALTGPRPTVARSQGARHAAPPSLPRAAARSHRAPSPEYRPAAARTHWARLVRIAPTACRRPHRIYPTACRHPHPPMSPPSRFRAHRPPHHDHRVPPPSYTCCASPSASRPPCADIRVTLSRCVGPGALAGKNRTVCIPFSPNALKRPPSWQHPPEMHAFRDQDGNILALCIHFRAQSGDSGYMARESCRQGPFFASRSPKSRMGEDVASAARPFCGSGMRSGRTGFAPCGSGMRHAAWPNGLCALRRGPGLLAACAPCHLARVHRRRLTRAVLRRPRPATRSPYRCISPPARRTHPASHADPPRPGNKRNNANNSMRA